MAKGKTNSGKEAGDTKSAAAGGGEAKPRSITKSELFQQLADTSGLSRAEVKKVYEALEAVIQKQLGKKGSGVLTLPGLFKLRAVRKPAEKGGKEYFNRLTGQTALTKAKPARTMVRARALKGLNESIK